MTNKSDDQNLYIAHELIDAIKRPLAGALLMKIGFAMDENRRCYLNDAELAKGSGLTIKQVKQNKKWLSDKGYITYDADSIHVVTNLIIKGR